MNELCCSSNTQIFQISKSSARNNLEIKYWKLLGIEWYK